MEIKITLGDITKSTSEAIVNAANTSLLGGGGVDGAIHRGAGKELLLECRKLNGCKTGEAKITKGYNLPCKYIIHTPGPNYLDGNHRESELLENSYRNSLELALEHNIRTISFPSISTGIFKFPLVEASKIAIKVFRQYKEKFQLIEMVCFNENTKKAYEEALNNIDK